MSYGSAAGVRLVNFKITEDVILDAAIEAMLEADIDPIINGLLGTTFSSAPALIVSCSNELGAAELVERHLIQDDDESGWATRIRKKWLAAPVSGFATAETGLLYLVRSGQTLLDGYSGVAAMSMSDPTLDEPAHRVFVNDEVDWAAQSIGRELAT